MIVGQTTLVAASDGSLDPQGPMADAIADLWWLMLILGVAVFVVFALLLGLALFRRWSPGADEAGAHRQLIRRWIVGGGVAMPAIVIIVVFVATLDSMRAVPASPDDGALEVEIIGHQFWYEVRYPEQDVVTANELHLPVGRQVALTLASADVIHSFWIPELGGKLDMMPEHTNTLVLQADQPGEYRARCAEFCGIQHARMVLVAVAHESDAFDTWMQEQQAVAEPATTQARRGQRVFIDAGCARCHAGPGVDQASEPGPDLRNLAERRMLAAATLDNTRENLVRWVSDPDSIKTGVAMPATDLSDRDLDALLAYLGYDG